MPGIFDAKSLDSELTSGGDVYVGEPELSSSRSSSSGCRIYSVARGVHSDSRLNTPTHRLITEALQKRRPNECQEHVRMTYSENDTMKDARRPSDVETITARGTRRPDMTYVVKEKQIKS
ncbi:hypothetical protein C0995_014691 [Termitomyces sp. Mi166|nr:hypothetical protein C0995_014691 [Termitomyces sp. Mi166\